MNSSSLPEENLRQALRELAAADAPAVLDRARNRARARAERLIENALVEELLDAAARHRSSEANRPAGDGRQPAETGADETSGALGATGDGRPVGSGKGDGRPVGGGKGDGRPVGNGKRAAPPGEANIDRAAEEARGSTDSPPHGQAWWTYCVLSSRDAAQMPLGLDGVDNDHPVEAVWDGDLAALVSQVPLSEYGDDHLREHLEDLNWLERTARRHETVLDAALRQATIVPLRLCTLYHDQEGVRRLLREHGVALRDGLSFVDGCVEWGVKVFVNPHANRSEVAAEVPDSAPRGATYLLRRQRERALAEKATEVRARCVEVAEDRIGSLARASTVNPPQRPEVHGRDLTMLLNGAYLVERGRAGELQEAVGTLQEEWQPLGFTIELTGPWPPYNFVSGAAGVSS